jgi:hypothetical protein
VEKWKQKGVHNFKRKTILIVRLFKVLVDRTIFTEVVQLTRPAIVIFLQLDFSEKARQDNIQNASKGSSFLSRLLRGHGSLVSDLKVPSLVAACITATFFAVGKEYMSREGKMQTAH